MDIAFLTYFARTSLYLIVVLPLNTRWVSLQGRKATISIFCRHDQDHGLTRGKSFNVVFLRATQTGKIFTGSG